MSRPSLLTALAFTILTGCGETLHDDLAPTRSQGRDADVIADARTTRDASTPEASPTDVSTAADASGLCAVPVTRWIAPLQTSPCGDNYPCLETFPESGGVSAYYPPDNAPIVSPAFGDAFLATSAYVLAEGYVPNDGGVPSGRLFEVPLGGGAPVVVDDVYSTEAAVDGLDGYVYYASNRPMAASSDMTTLTLNRIPSGAIGGATAVLATLPQLDSMIVREGYVYVATDGGLLRVPVTGGATETILTTGLLPNPYATGAFAVGGGYVFFGKNATVLRVPVGGGTPTTIITADVAPAPPLTVGESPWSEPVLVGGSPLALYVVGQTTVEQLTLDGVLQGTVLTTPGADGWYGFQTPTFEGSRLYVTDACGESAPLITPYYDTATRTTGILENEPGFPFVPGPMTSLGYVFFNDPTGAYLFYMQPPIKG